MCSPGFCCFDSMFMRCPRPLLLACTSPVPVPPSAAWRPEGEWIARLDLVEEGDRLIVKEMDVVRACARQMALETGPVVQ